MGEGILPYRNFLVVIRTKTDPARRPIHYSVQTVTKTHHTLGNQKFNRIELRPKFEDQTREIWQAYETIFKQGGWTVYNDEQWYIEEELGLKRTVNKLLTQGGGKGITVVMGAQRPSGISRFCISQSTHVLCAAIEGRDIKVISDATSPKMGFAAAQLQEHEFAWFHRSTREVIVVKLDIRSGQMSWRPAPQLEVAGRRTG